MNALHYIVDTLTSLYLGVLILRLIMQMVRANFRNPFAEAILKLTNPLIMLAPALCARVADGGTIALSGVLAGQADDVRAAYDPWFTLAAVRADEGWILLSPR